jgi:hypothetical protein
VHEKYLSLTQKEQAQILRSLYTNSNVNRDVILLEKDIWICWALEHLFKMPNRLPMAFKGGTSLSKAFKVISRFSEDVDITIDYKAFNCEDPFSDGLSKAKIKNISFELRSMLTQHIKEIIIPYFGKVIIEQFDKNPPTVVLGNDDETLYLNYLSVVEQKSGYITDSVRLEFGGRNITIPNDVWTIKTDISEHINNLLFPEAEVTVLSAEKTFWEKITLIHYACNRSSLKKDANRISRHWYDISRLAADKIGKRALSNRELLSEVIKIKKTFYNSGFAKYDDCLNGGLRLVPNDDYLRLLENDFTKMVSNNMFYGVQPDFNAIVSDIKELERVINEI